MNNIIFLGTNTFAAEILDLLIKKNISISAVFTKNPSKYGRGQKLTPHPVEIIAKKNKCIIHNTKNINSEVELIKKYTPNLLIVVDFGMILKKSIIDIPKFGCINIHPSILPKFRGPSPIQEAIMKGEKETGVSIIKISEKIDKGDILKIKKCKIESNDTYLTLSKKLINLGYLSTLEVINELKNNKIKYIKQLEIDTSYTHKISKNIFKINWNETATTIERKTKALLMRNKSTFTYIKKKYIKILYATVIKSKIYEKAEFGSIVNVDKSGIYVSTKENLIRIEKIQIEGKKPINANDLINSNNNLFDIGNKFY